MIENIVVGSTILRVLWLRGLLEQKKDKLPRKPMVLKPKTDREYRFCHGGKGKGLAYAWEQPELWREWKRRGSL